MSVDFSFDAVIDIIADTVFGGSTDLAGIAIMILASFIAMMIIASLNAPVTFSLVPMFLIAIWFSTAGIIDTTLGFTIIVITAVVIAIGVRRMVAEG